MGLKRLVTEIRQSLESLWFKPVDNRLYALIRILFSALALINLIDLWPTRYEFFSDVVAQTNPEIGFIALDDNPEKAIELVARLRESAPDCSILVASSSKNLAQDIQGAGQGRRAMDQSEAPPERRRL